MSAFSSLDWARFDVWGIVAGAGIAVVKPEHRENCHAWLQRHDYAISSSDFGQGIGPAVVALGDLFRWEEQFGYALQPHSRNLAALRDGFEFDLDPGQGHVLELVNADSAYREDPHWLLGLLSIAQEYSLRELALGARFFAILVLDGDSVLIGKPYESLSVPGPFSQPSNKADPFGPSKQAKGAASPSSILTSGRPDPGEYADYAQADIDMVEGDDAVEVLLRLGKQMVTLFQELGEPNGNVTYAPGKWTVKQILGHLADDERIFAYRALCVARGDSRPLPGFDENDYAAAARFENRSLADLLADFEAVRHASITLFGGLDQEAWLRKGIVNGYSASPRGLAFHIAGHELHHLRILRERYLPLVGNEPHRGDGV